MSMEPPAPEEPSPDLRPGLMSLSPWEANALPPAPPGELFGIWSALPGAHKWLHYFPVYERVFGEYRDRPLKVLEIGVYRGASLKMWKGYFHPLSEITGIDTDPGCRECADAQRGIHVRTGSQSDPAFLREVTAELGPFDVIIDDGSHAAGDMIASFNLLFDRGLRPGGVYLVEDVHADFWTSPPAGGVSFLNFVRGLAEAMHAHYARASSELHFRVGAGERIRRFEVPRITRLLAEIRIFDSIAVFYKCAEGERRVPASLHL